MADVSGALRSTVPISLFNRGLAGKVFEEVRQQGAKVVMKNNAPECVLLSPEEYLRLIDEVNDAKLAALAAQRMQNFDADKAIPAEEVYQKYGISDADLADFDEVEFELTGASNFSRRRRKILMPLPGISAFWSPKRSKKSNRIPSRPTKAATASRWAAKAAPICPGCSRSS